MESLNENSKDKKMKSTNENIPFFINFSSSKEPLMHEFLGNPRIPLLGKYTRDSYLMADIQCLIIDEYKFDQLKQLPISNEITDYIKTILESDKLLINNSSFKFYWVVSNNTIESKDQIYNIVPHTFLFPYIDFSQTKQIIKHPKICMLLPTQIINSSGVEQLNEIKKDKPININIGELRKEYTRIHLIKQSIGLSPNGLKVKILNKFNLSHFYLLILDEDGQLHLFYYWIVNNKDTSSILDKIWNKSSNLNELVESLKGLSKNEYSDEIIRLFS